MLTKKNGGQIAGTPSGGCIREGLDSPRVPPTSISSMAVGDKNRAKPNKIEVKSSRKNGTTGDEDGDVTMEGKLRRDCADWKECTVCVRERGGRNVWEGVIAR